MAESKTESYKGCEIETRVSELGDFYMGTFRILLLPDATEVLRFCPGIHRSVSDAHSESVRLARRIVDVVKGGVSPLTVVA